MKRFARIAAIGFGVMGLVALLGPYAIPIDAYRSEVTGPFPESAVVDVNGVRVHYRAWTPQTEPLGNVALVHGFCGSTFSWRKNVPALVEAGWRVVAVDVPAFGYSDRAPTVDHTIAARNRYVWGAVDDAAGDASAEWWLVGHSMGGGIVEAMAQMEGARTAGVVFVDGGGWSLGEQRARSGLRTAAMGFGPLRRWTEIYARHVAFTEQNIRKLLTSAFGSEPEAEAVGGYLEALKVPRTASAILDQWRAPRDETSDLNPARITAPVLIVWGEEDTWVPLERGKLLGEAIPHAQLTVIADAGHNVMETHPDEFNQTLLSFLAQSTAATEKATE